MESAWPLILFLAFLFGSMLLMLVLGYASIEKARDEAATTASVTEAGQLRIPRFFVQLGTDGRPAGVRELDADLVTSIERFLREEHRLAVEFVEDPFVSAPQPDSQEAGEPAEGLFERIERFLRSEQVLAAAFVSEPSVESLYGRLRPAAAGI